MSIAAFEKWERLLSRAGLLVIGAYCLVVSVGTPTHF